MSEGPTWIITDPAKSYSDERFDGMVIIPDASTPIWASEMGTMPPLDPQQPTPEQIADAARAAADDIALVFRLLPYGNLDPLGSLRMLHLLLAPPAPKWTATEEPE